MPGARWTRARGRICKARLLRNIQYSGNLSTNSAQRPTRNLTSRPTLVRHPMLFSSQTPATLHYRNQEDHPPPPPDLPPSLVVASAPWLLDVFSNVCSSGDGATLLIWPCVCSSVPCKCMRRALAASRLCFSLPSSSSISSRSNGIVCVWPALGQKSGVAKRESRFVPK